MGNKYLNKCYILFIVRTQSSVQNGRQSYSSVAVQEPKPFKSIPGLSSLPIIGPLHHFLPVIVLRSPVLFGKKGGHKVLKDKTVLKQWLADISQGQHNPSKHSHVCKKHFNPDDYVLPKEPSTENRQFGPKANLFDLTGTLHKKFGNIVKMQGVLARADMVILFEPEHIDQVYRAQEANPLRPGFQTLEYFREVAKKGTLDGLYGLTTAQGDKWRDFRTKVNPALLKLKLVKVYAPGLDEIAHDTVQRLKRLKDDKTYLENNFALEMNKWSLESIALVALGTRMGCLDDNLPDDHPGRKLMQCGKDIIDTAFELEFLPSVWKYISTPAFKKIMKTFDTQWEISTKYIAEARKRINERGYDIPEEEKSIVERLLAIDERVAVLMANEMLFAGIDTAAFAATSVIYNLAINPDKQEKLREEIRSEDPRKRYLRACLKEALRLWHVVPSNLRRTDREHIVGGYLIPKGVDVVAPNEYLSRLEKYYPRPNDFIPERWLADKSDPLYYGNAHPMITLPFGFGIRSCIGRRIAELEIETLMKRLFDELKVTWEGPPIKVVNKLTNAFVGPYNFRFENAK